MNTPRWNALTVHVDEYEYTHELLTQAGGPPSNVSIDMVTGDHLIPFINSVRNRQAFIINCYGLTDRADEQPFPEIIGISARYARIAETMDVNALGDAPDDVVIYGEDDHNLWMFWMHRSNRCEVVKMSKTVTLEVFIESHMTHLRDSYKDGWRYNDESKDAIIHRIQGQITEVSWV